MLKTLSILIAEDCKDDVEMVMAELRRAGFDPQWRRVETEPDFLAGLDSSPDIILSDFAMPEFNGLRAAQLNQVSGLDIPFILISGPLGEDAAVEAMKQGVTDYFLKDRIGRLGAAVEHALAQKAIRANQKQADASVKLFRTLIDQSSDGIEVIDPQTGRFLDVNQTTCDRLGYTREEMLALSVPDVETEAVDLATWSKHVAEIRQAGFKILVGCHKCKDGSTFPIEVNVRLVTADREYLIASVRDITERRRAENESRKQFQELERWHEAMLGREERVLELKHEVNELLARLKEPARYGTSTNP
jgi:PAS domain S-box-containing protein